jgi:hypothetical protein
VSSSISGSCDAEERTAVRLLEDARALRDGAGEGALS